MSLEPWTRTGVKSGGEKVPARDDYEAFRQWWKVHSSVESARLDQPQRLLVLTNPRVRIQGSRTFEAMSSQHNVVVTRHGRRPCGGGLPDDFSDHSDGHDSQSMR